ncbi:mitotic interactor and substrate of PLK1 [Arapaima gigas]
MRGPSHTHTGDRRGRVTLRHVLSAADKTCLIKEAANRCNSPSSVCVCAHDARGKSSAELVEPPSHEPRSSNPRRGSVACRRNGDHAQETDLRNPLASSREQEDQERRWPCNSENEQNGSLTLVTSRQHSVTVTSSPSDANHQVLVRSCQVQVSEGGNSAEWDASWPSSPGSTSSAESQQGFYSFVDEESEAAKNEAWMSSPERQAKLETLREENGFKLQAYVEEKKPEKLFQDTNNDSCYRVEGTQVVERDERKQMQERLEIIRSQAPRRNLASAEEWSALNMSNSSQMLEDLSLRYSPSSTEKSPTEAESGPVDTGRINFSAARQQFLKMEQSKSSPSYHSSQELPTSKTQRRAFQQDGGTDVSRKDTCESPSGEQLNASQSFGLEAVRKNLFGSRNTSVCGSEETADMSQRCLDSGLKHSPGDHGSSRSDDSSKVLGWEETDSLSSFKTETPIEREIRLAQEREESLRRERGIKWSDTTEMVEIKTASLLSQTRPPATVVKAKERNRVSFFIQREIQMESQREVDLQHQGKVLGLYDRGTPQELEERKRVFEQQADLVPAVKMSSAGTEADGVQDKTGAEEGVRTLRSSVSVEKDKASKAEDILSPCWPHRRPDERPPQLFSSETFVESLPTKEGSPHTPPAQSILLPADNTNVVDGGRNQVTTSQTTTVVRTEKPSTVHLDSSLQVADKGSPSARCSPSLYSPHTLPSTPTGLTSQTSRPNPRWTGSNERFNLRPRKVHTPEAIRREIEQDLKREEELRKLRDTSVVSTSQDSDQDCHSAQDEERGTLRPVFRSARPNVLVLRVETTQKHDRITAVTPEDQPGHREGNLPSVGSDTVDHRGPEPTTSKVPEKLAVHSPRLVSGFSSVSIVTAQPWSSQRPNTPTATRFVPLRPPVAKGLTESLLDDYEERRIRARTEEAAYAGIQPTDEVNNEVLESTRVTRHKNTRALQWEAGLFANKAED